jgi:hypothetical protein
LFTVFKVDTRFKSFSHSVCVLKLVSLCLAYDQT